MLFFDFRYQLLCTKGPTLSYCRLIIEIKKTLFRLKKIKADNTEMEDQNTYIFNEGQSNHNEMPGIWEPTLGDC